MCLAAIVALLTLNHFQLCQWTNASLLLVAPPHVLSLWLDVVVIIGVPRANAALLALTLDGLTTSRLTKFALCAPSFGSKRN